MTTTEYKEEKLICGNIITDQVPLKADTYYRGMPLTYDSDTNLYGYSATGSVIFAVYLGGAQETSRVLSTSGYGSVIKSGELYEEGFVNDSNVALTIDEDFKAAAGVRGFHIRRK